MFSISIFDSESRRSGTDRRKHDAGAFNGTERRGTDRRRTGDRRRDSGRRAGLYYKIPDEKRDIVERIILNLESKNWENW